MRSILKYFGCFLVAALLSSSGFRAQAQDPPPSGGFKNAYLTLNKSGKVVLTYTLWKDQVGKGKYVLAFFWASWSDEAREEAANVQKIYKNYASKGLNVLGVTFGDEIQDSMDAIPEWGMTFPHIVCVEDYPPDGLFDFSSVPFIVLLGPDGAPVATDLHGEAIEEAVKKVL